MIYCYEHTPGGKSPYYTAVHIPADEKKAEAIMRHLAEIVEADKHRDPTDYERSLGDHPYYNEE